MFHVSTEVLRLNNKFNIGIDFASFRERPFNSEGGWQIFSGQNIHFQLLVGQKIYFMQSTG